MARESPQETRELVEALVHEAERQGLSEFVTEHRGHKTMQFDADLLAHKLPSTKRKADRVAKLLEERYDAEKYPG